MSHYPLVFSLILGTVLAISGRSTALGRQPAGEARPKQRAADSLSEMVARPDAGLAATTVTAAPDYPRTDTISPDLAALRNRIREVLAAYYPKHQNTRDNDTWEVMHEIIAYGVDAQLFRGGPGGPKVNAIGWLCFNGNCKGEQLFYLDHGKLVARKGPGVQGHFGQFLAIVAQSHLQADYPMQVQGKTFTIRDLIDHEKENCQAGEELTFKLIGLMHYLDSDETWTSRDGEQWSIQRLIAEELKQPIRGAACGGTHRLMGFSYAINKRIKRGKPIVGEFRRAQTFIRDYHRYTFGLQNPDGSFSTKWFVRSEANPSVDRRLKTTGHIAEWLCFSLSDDELRDPRMVKAIEYLVTILEGDKSHSWEIGPLGHGLHALALYHNRVFEPKNAGSSDIPIVGPPSEFPLERLPPVREPPAASALAPFETPAEEPVAEMARKPRLSLGIPACEIGNDPAHVPRLPPEALVPPGDDDDEHCL